MPGLKSSVPGPISVCHSEEEQPDFRDYVLDVRGNWASGDDEQSRRWNGGHLDLAFSFFETVHDFSEKSRSLAMLGMTPVLFASKESSNEHLRADYAGLLVLYFQ